MELDPCYIYQRWGVLCATQKTSYCSCWCTDMAFTDTRECKSIYVMCVREYATPVIGGLGNKQQVATN